MTTKQQQYFEDYYFNNLSLSEMSENLGISRNAINKQLHKAVEKLEYYEKQLELYQKKQKVMRYLDKINIEKSIKEKIEEFI